MDTMEYISGLIEKAKVAQKVFETYTQEQVDLVVKTVGKAVYDKGEELAKLAVEESKMGSYENKIMKNKGKAMAVWNHLKDKKSVGIINYIDEKGLVEVAKPMGVIGAIAPVTNPVMTPMHNTMIALKGGNAIIIAPHPSAKKTGVETTRVINEALKKIGAPENLVQCIEEPTVEASNLLMQMADVTVATGGPGMVKAAYSSGKPAYGVGAGNMQCIIDFDADIVDAVPKIITGRTYDNGVLCTCEQNFVCPESRFDEIIAEFKKNGGYYVEDPKEAQIVRDTFFPNGALNKQAVGLTAPVLAKMAGLEVPEGTRVLIVKANGFGKDEILSKEKLFPILSAYTYKTFEEAVDIVNANLEFEGKGHSTVIHSFTKEHIEYAGCKIPVSRLLVNGIGSSGVGGAYSNGFIPTATLGCGSWGNNSISENLDYKHLINITRIGYTNLTAKVPTPEEIWG